MASERPKWVEITDVGPRDGLQNESGTIPTADKIAFADGLARAGLIEIELSSFVSPKWVPQLADAAEVFAGIERRPGVRYSALVPNAKGMERALAAGADKVGVFTSASETFNRRNVNADIAASIERFVPVVAAAREHSIPVRGYVSNCFGCPYEGAIAPGQALDVIDRLFDAGVDEVGISDTIGVATPNQVTELGRTARERWPVEQLFLHFHDTRGTALANVVAALDLGFFRFDASAGGLGGCPYAPGAAGNLATEDLIYLLDGLGVESGVDLEALVTASEGIERVLGRPLPGRVYQATQGKRRRAAKE